MAQNETYEHFVNKFKPKKTTDDCYTPGPVYDYIADWVSDKFNLSQDNFIRPFYPGGDFESEDYTGKVVVDNPPFSILTKIVRFYIKNNIKFFMFAPSLVLINIDKSEATKFTKIPTFSNIMYENGAKIQTSFVTNLFDDTPTFYIDRDFADDLSKVCEILKTSKTTRRPRYSYPDNVISVSSLRYAVRGSDEPWKIYPESLSFTNKLDSQKAKKKGIFGGGYLVSDQIAAKLQAAKLQAAKLQAAKLQAAKLQAAKMAHAWQLSDREKEIIKSLR